MVLCNCIHSSTVFIVISYDSHIYIFRVKLIGYDDNAYGTLM